MESKVREQIRTIPLFVPLLPWQTDRRTPQIRRPGNLISISAKMNASMGAAQFQIENLLRLRQITTTYDDFTVNNQKDLLQTVNTSRVVDTYASGDRGDFLLVGGIGIMNIMLVS